MTGAPAQTSAAGAVLAALCSELPRVREMTTVALAQARGRILARDVLATLDAPAFDCSAVDGYAVRSADCVGPVRLTVTGSALAGHAGAPDLAKGSALRIMTGAPLPAGADAVVMRENASFAAGSVQLDAGVAPGACVRPRGEHFRRGEAIVPAGVPLDALALGLATAGGATQVAVFRALRVGLASTGDELVDPPATPGPAHSHDGNRPLLVATCRAAGLDATDFGICPDSADAFAELTERATAAGLDALVVSGGTAKGDADVVRQAPSVRFLDLGIWPGRGIVFRLSEGSRGRLALFGLPGSAVSTFVMLHLVVLPALLHCAGAAARVPWHVPLPLASDASGRAGRVEYQRARFERTPDGRIGVRPLERQGAALLRVLMQSDVLVAIGPRAAYRAGELVPALPLATLPR